MAFFIQIILGTFHSNLLLSSLVINFPLVGCFYIFFRPSMRKNCNVNILTLPLFCRA